MIDNRGGDSEVRRMRGSTKISFSSFMALDLTMNREEAQSDNHFSLAMSISRSRGRSYALQRKSSSPFVHNRSLETTPPSTNTGPQLRAPKHRRQPPEHDSASKGLPCHAQRRRQKADLDNLARGSLARRKAS